MDAGLIARPTPQHQTCLQPPTHGCKTGGSGKSDHAADPKGAWLTAAQTALSALFPPRLPFAQRLAARSVPEGRGCGFSVYLEP